MREALFTSVGDAKADVQAGREDDYERRGYNAKDWAFNGLLLYSVIVTVILVWWWI